MDGVVTRDSPLSLSGPTTAWIVVIICDDLSLSALITRIELTGADISLSRSELTLLERVITTKAGLQHK